MLTTVGTVGNTFVFDGAPSYFQDSNIVWLHRKTESVLNEYIYWFCRSRPWKLPERATLKHLHNYMIEETEISIPSIDVQNRVISLFRRIDDNNNKLMSVLCAEIAARQKQYEHYRDKLLTFKRKN